MYKFCVVFVVWVLCCCCCCLHIEAKRIHSISRRVANVTASTSCHDMLPNPAWSARLDLEQTQTLAHTLRVCVRHDTQHTFSFGLQVLSDGTGAWYDAARTALVVRVAIGDVSDTVFPPQALCGAGPIRPGRTPTYASNSSSTGPSDGNVLAYVVRSFESVSAAGEVLTVANPATLPSNTSQNVTFAVTSWLATNDSVFMCDGTDMAPPMSDNVELVHNVSWVVVTPPSVSTPLCDAVLAVPPKYRVASRVPTTECLASMSPGALLAWRSAIERCRATLCSCGNTVAVTTEDPIEGRLCRDAIPRSCSQMGCVGDYEMCLRRQHETYLRDYKQCLNFFGSLFDQSGDLEVQCFRWICGAVENCFDAEYGAGCLTAGAATRVVAGIAVVLALSLLNVVLIIL